MSNPTVEATGTLNATAGGTEDVVSTINTSRVLAFVVNATNMAAGDTITVRAYRKVVSGGALVEFYRESFTFPIDGGLGLISVPMPSPHQAQFSITQEVGSTKAFEWSVESM